MGQPSAPSQAGAPLTANEPTVARPKQTPAPLEVALTSPDRIEANAGQVTAFPIAIDATRALPAHSIVSITALPEGASFSIGRPYGANGWSLRPDEIADVQLRLPAQGGASNVRLELVAGDGTVLSQSETRLSIAPSPAEIATAGATASEPSVETAQAEQPDVTGALPPTSEQTPTEPAGTEAEVKVNTVKLVTIEPPKPGRPHDGAMALGSPADEPAEPAEWMLTKTAVDMHAKAQQSSETVKVAEGGVKMRVVARDKRWIQVTDPTTSATGWIYDRFLKDTDPPTQ